MRCAPELAERLWLDPERRPAWCTEARHLARREGQWPQPGSRVVWDAAPPGGRVVERVLAFDPGRGLRVEVEDARLRGQQTVTWSPTAGGVVVAVQLEYALKRAGPLGALLGALVVRHAIADELRSALQRFGNELRADDELLY